MGFEICIDDFGTGFASLSALQELPVTGVKIIETEDDLATIRRLGCRYAHGYHFARPMPEDEIVSRYAGLISAGTDARRA